MANRIKSIQTDATQHIECCIGSRKVEDIALRVGNALPLNAIAATSNDWNELEALSVAVGRCT